MNKKLIIALLLIKAVCIILSLITRSIIFEYIPVILYLFFFFDESVNKLWFLASSLCMALSVWTGEVFLIILTVVSVYFAFEDDSWHGGFRGRFS